MYYTKKKIIGLCLITSFIFVGVCSNLYAQNAKDWTAKIRAVHERLDRQNTFSVMGDRVGQSVQRIIFKQEQKELLKQTFANQNAEVREACNLNYQALTQAVHSSGLFAHYDISSFLPETFCQMTAADVNVLADVLQNKKSPDVALKLQEDKNFQVEREGIDLDEDTFFIMVSEETPQNVWDVWILTHKQMLFIAPVEKLGIGEPFSCAVKYSVLGIN